MRRLRSLLLLVLMLLVSVGCAAAPATDPPDPNPSAGDPEGAWVLAEGSVDDQRVPILENGRITLTIDGSRIGGRAACNGYGARLTSTAGELALADLASTAMACVDEEVMRAETLYMAALTHVRAIRPEGEQLLVTGPDVELRFNRLPPPPTAQLVDTVWVLEALVDGDAVSSVPGEGPILEVRRDGTIRGTTGCRDFDGTWIEDGDEILATSLSTTPKACEAALVELDAHVLAVVSEGFRATVEGDTLTLRNGATGLVYRATE